MDNIIAYAQITVSILMIALILLQQRGTGLGSAFGGGDNGGYSTLRGMQKKIYWATLGLGVVFIGLAVYNLFVK